MEKMNNTNPTKNGDELRCRWRVNSSCSTNGTCHVQNPVIRNERGKQVRLGLRQNGTCPWSSETQIVRNGYQSQDGDSHDFNLITRNHWFSSFLVCSNTLSRNYRYEPQALEYRINWEMHTPYAVPVGMLLYIHKTLNGKFKIWKLIWFDIIYCV